MLHVPPILFDLTLLDLFYGLNIWWRVQVIMHYALLCIIMHYVLHNFIQLSGISFS
jgi:hypothetical protein